MEELGQALRDLDEKKVHALLEEKIKKGVPVMEIVRACNEGMVAVGELFSKGDYFISQLIFSAEILKAVMKRLDPLLQGAEPGKSRGRSSSAPSGAIFMILARTSSSPCSGAPVLK